VSSEFDWELLQRAARINGATDIALTFVDYLDVRNRDARRFDQLQQETIYFIEEVEDGTTMGSLSISWSRSLGKPVGGLRR